MNKILALAITLVITGCAGTKIHSKGTAAANSDELMDFAKASCFSWYFKKKGYELDDIKSISGGIVELGSYSAEKFREVAFLVKDYNPGLSSKNNIDIDLQRCFLMEKDPTFVNTIDEIRKQ
jgi:hypothetical protein